jgi:NADH dehydrogenase
MGHIVIVGGGFAGLWGAMAGAQVLDEARPDGGDIRITLLSRDPWLTIRPRLHEAHPGEAMRVPLQGVLEPLGIALMEATVTDLDPGRRAVLASRPGGPARPIPFDRLLLAAGSRLERPAVPGADSHAWSVDTYDEALALEVHLRALPAAPDGPGRYTVVVVGAGFTGIEVAAEMMGRLREIAGGAPAAPRVVLVERAPVVGPELGELPRPVIEEALDALGVERRVGTTVRALDSDGATLDNGERLLARTVVWTTGLRANPLAARLGVATDDLGRVPVDETLEVRGHSGVFAAGDVARAMAETGHPTLMSCQHALSMGRVAGANIVRSLLGRQLAPYTPPPYVTCLDLGPWGALLTRGWAREPVKIGADAKAVKRSINTGLIYPPSSGDRRQILEAALGSGRRRPTA